MPRCSTNTNRTCANTFRCADTVDWPTATATAATAASDAPDAPAALDATSATYVEVFACPADLARVTDALAPRYAQLEVGEGFATSRRSS